jgi:hypothetical protein
MDEIIKLKDLYTSKVYLTFTEVTDVKQYELFVKALLKSYPNMREDPYWSTKNKQISGQKGIGLFVYPDDAGTSKGRYGICDLQHISTKYKIDFGNKKAIALSYIKSLKDSP